MAGVMLTFAGAFATFTYLRPFLEDYTHVTVPQLSLLLLGLGMAGFAGTYAASTLLRRQVYPLLRRLPLALGATKIRGTRADSSNRLCFIHSPCSPRW